MLILGIFLTLDTILYKIEREGEKKIETYNKTLYFFLFQTYLKKKSNS